MHMDPSDSLEDGEHPNMVIMGRSESRSFFRSALRGTHFEQNKIPANVPSFREQIIRTSPVESFRERVKRPTIRRQVLFFIAGSCLAYSLATSQTQAETDYWFNRLTSVTHLDTTLLPVDVAMRRLQSYEESNKVSTLKFALSEWPILLKQQIISTYISAANRYYNASEGKRLCWMICGLNTMVYLAWKVPRFGPTMNRIFTHHPLSGLSYTLLTSMFSHKTFLHLAANSIALTSFGSAATTYLSGAQISDPDFPPESTSRWHFLAFYLSAGVFSGLVSHVAAAKVLYPRLVSQLAKAAPITPAVEMASKTSALPRVREILPSLGASGAIYAAVTLSALGFPDAEVTLMFPPFMPINIQTGVGALVLLDTIGILRGWRMFDHYAHLGGAAFGVMYYMYGPTWWNYLRGSIAPDVEEGKGELE
ncbi:hypothetical protein BJ138DRAFT_1133792 [Hygrophoropsis aurantiaca]|uniref:Uncharacterized protein n=1 Tax=Hygrophoropsis aurantiaca TaxID=72124 RepID=A0ACB8AJU6_9AGAM|nr:hypothetical protein BJ138DRAFT_1133792 [Hygrophoropsis aurantiaca]